MSLIALEFAKSFVNGRITAQVFAEAYIELYRIERDNGLLLKDEDSVSECLSTIFCLADLYNPDFDKEEYELNDKQLIEQIEQELKKLN
ncbi:colicin immunity domain-containing protein [Snodgrassella sp. W8132]|uniref:colicin immunity domain-containing protein n=1 Tax=Snodgrassella sp. W8132 TaxID=2750994 RepID=UPI0018DE8DDC|nr:colicin immunity domain-containing protein [Snodgrassella sp. W8132]MBI0132170.1 colicin immunity protein [Snodgrassella sp. W8132]